MQENISLWLSARHPVCLAAVQPDNACLSIYIRGILILFLCLGWGRGGLGAGILWMLLFTGDRSKANQTLAWKKTTDYASPVPHPTAPILLDVLSEGYYSLLVWFVLPLALVVTWWDDEKMKKTMARRKSDRHICDWARNDNLVPPSWSRSSRKLTGFNTQQRLSRWSTALFRIHCGVSWRACQGPLKLSHTGHRKDVEVQSAVFPQKPP